MEEQHRRNVADNRRMAALEARKREKEMDSLFALCDWDHSSGLAVRLPQILIQCIACGFIWLHRDCSATFTSICSMQWGQLQLFLKKVAGRHGRPDYEPSDEDGMWVISKATGRGAGEQIGWQDWRDGKLELSKKDAARVLPEYICYLSHLKMIEEVFEDYDTNDDGLDKEELKGVLTQLNDGKAVADDLVDEVMKEADGTADGRVSKLELGRAIAVWYAQQLPSDKKRALTGRDGQLTASAAGAKTEEGLVALTQGKSGSACCALQ